ncbi:flagellar motor protein MotD [Pseudoxanthomonas sp. CAU 1598]|uniref:Flagellar motor protein MotD n=1 Tax=Pseudomarimonas arenosa TaxID=2774145 RepID=A0AAW3ZGM5_9GAMM|nr:flagellar motor protein MotD [Pseudomarimonas arenosa]MBD8524719.1 flagellar motor protein MotD [Pseudomarimonas arenosa]
MARRKHHEEHANHEAWAIPYGDLITLLLAFFVVMYAISSVNEGKYRVLSTSLNAAFGGPQTRLNPISVGDNSGGESSRRGPIMLNGSAGIVSPFPTRLAPRLPPVGRQLDRQLPQPMLAADRHQVGRARDELNTISNKIETALGGLIERGLVEVKKTDLWVEVAIKSDILFESGVAKPNQQAVRVLGLLADSLIGTPNPLRVEGHTDNRPISTAFFPSNWELSSARAASVVRIFADQGVNPDRMSIVGYGERRPVADNETVEGRNANRRVVVVILADIQPTDDGDLESTVDDTTGMLTPSEDNDRNGG